jgi:hypothetical protein
MSRYEYQNAIRDLLGITLRVEDWLPAEEASHGFDNITVSELPPVLLNRYIAAAQEISRIAMGGSQRTPGGITKRFPADLSQDTHIQGLPLGTRGGGWIEHTFAREGQYEIQVRLARDRDEKVEGLRESIRMDFLVDNARVQSMTIDPPKGGDHTRVDTNLKAQVSIPAGVHRVAVTFPRTSGSLQEIRRQPFDASFNRHRHPRREPAVYEITIVGPLDVGAAGFPDSRRKLFEGILARDVPYPSEWESAKPIATALFERLLRRAYRRPIHPDDLEIPLAFFRKGFVKDGFESGIESALASILVNPNFLLRIEHTPAGASKDTTYALSDVELANRLSFFLWSSIPDDELMQSAIDGTLSNETVLQEQTARMLSDSKAISLVESFADQWLYLRNLDSIHPDLRLFPDFDDNLRQSLRKETELLFASVVHEDRNVLDLIHSSYTFLNDRLARHYRIPNIVGSHFRRVEVSPEWHRGGILRHGSVLTVTSYATRTSPTIRGSWIMKNILGTPAPPPPPNVPTLQEKKASASFSLRERLAQHRENPACASCHDLMDPIGFSLENYDAVGRWRTSDDDLAIDATGRLPDGTPIHSPDELEAQILERGELFVQAFAEKLLTYALGRGVEWTDGPEIRKIVASSKKQDFRFSSIVQAIVLSQPFRMRTVP